MLAEPGHRDDAARRLSERGHLPGHLLVEAVDHLVEVVDVVEVHPGHEGVVLPEAADESEAQVRDLGAHPGLGQLGEHLGVTLAGDEGLQHLAAGLAEHVGDHRVELDAGVLQDLLDPLDLPGAVLGELVAVAGEIPEALRDGRRDEAPPQQPALQELGEPLGVLGVGLAAVLGVGEEQLDAGHLLQDVPHRPPVDPRGLHGHLGHPFGCQPVPQLVQSVGEGRELPPHRDPLAVFRLAYAGHHGLLVHVQPGAALHDHIQLSPPVSRAATSDYRHQRASGASRICYACSWQQSGVPNEAPRQSLGRAHGTNEARR